MRRREFIAGLGAAAWPLVARAQQGAIPVVGFLNPGRPGGTADDYDFTAVVRSGLADAGYTIGRNVAVEYRWAEDNLDRLPAFAADLVRMRVAVIVTVGTPAAVAAKAASTSIPIVFAVGSNPVEAGLVASLNRPGGNLTGISILAAEVAAKRLELLHELLPAAKLLAYLANPHTRGFADAEKMELETAAHLLGVNLLQLNASDPSDFEPAFATLVREQAKGLVVGGDVLFLTGSAQLAALADRHTVPAIYSDREAVPLGGLMSYGTVRSEADRQVGVYAGRVLSGERPVDLPVQQVTKMQLALNMKTAKALGLTFPLTLLGRADEVIE
jgi:putative tryptophan/tyrosine transport system substrate-binding protein